METENGDDFIRKTASFIRAHEQRLGDIPIARGRQQQASSSSVLSWIGFGSPEQTNSKPLLFTEDPHHLFYLLMRLEALGIDVGSLDVRVQNLSRPTNIEYLTMLALKDSDVLSISSLRSTMSSVSLFSLGGGWLTRKEPPSLDSELKYIYSCFTRLPAIRIRASGGPKMISELVDDPPLDSAIPMDAFKSLQMLECQDIDPRILLGWDHLSLSLRSLSVKRSGLEDVADLMVDSVIDDKARREENGTVVGRPRLIHRPSTMRSSRRSSLHLGNLPPSVREDAEEDSPAHIQEEQSTIEKSLPSYAWSLLIHLCFADNNLTFLPTLPPLPNLSSLDLSSNLLISAPPSLAALPRLKSLNLANNMIDSVTGIYSQIPSIISLNISGNRLDSLCGLERLQRLARIDLRDNQVEDVEEVGRLAVLTGIKEIWVAGNPCTSRFYDWRVRCFDLFAKENREVVLDGSAPGLMERRSMAYQVNKNPNFNPRTLNGRPLSQVPATTSVSAPTTPVSQIPRTRPTILSAEPSLRATTSREASSTSSDISPAIIQHKARRKKPPKRFVDLNGTDGSPEDTSAETQWRPKHSKHNSETGPRRRLKTVDDSPRSPKDSDNSEAKTSPGPNTESEAPPSPMGPQTISGAKTISHTATKSSKRRARLSPSMFEPSFATMALSNSQDHGNDPQNHDGLSDADRLRQRIEALKNEVGDHWLKVLSQTHLTSPDEAPARRKS